MNGVQSDVILIDDGNNIHWQQFFESVDCIKITRSLVGVYKCVISGIGQLEIKETTIYPKYLPSLKELVQWVVQADHIDYPKAL